jgi:hypothetical protein
MTQFMIREVGRKHPFHSLAYNFSDTAQNRCDELNRLEARKEDGTKYEVVSTLQLAIEEDRDEKYRQLDDE